MEERRSVGEGEVHPLSRNEGEEEDIDEFRARGKSLGRLEKEHRRAALEEMRARSGGVMAVADGDWGEAAEVQRRREREVRERDRAQSVEEWHREAFERFLLADRPDGHSRDDILYFVPGEVGTSRVERVDEENETSGDGRNALHVRRWTDRIPAEFRSGSAHSIHWHHSLLLNLVLQTKYMVTVAVCSTAAVTQKKAVQRGGLSNPFHKITKQVYASPYSIAVSGSGRGEEGVPTQSFPTLFFAIGEDAGGELESVRLTDEDNCFCVLLTAWMNVDLWGCKEDKAKVPNKVRLFSGLVTYQQVKKSYQGNFGWKDYLRGQKPSQRLPMRGPKGKGQAEVIVEDVGDDNGSDISDPKKHKKSQSAVRTAMSVASGPLRGVIGAARNAVSSTSRQGESNESSLRCVLVSLQLPWEAVACDLLKSL